MEVKVVPKTVSFTLSVDPLHKARRQDPGGRLQIMRGKGCPIALQLRKIDQIIDHAYKDVYGEKPSLLTNKHHCFMSLSLLFDH